jgi:hypothetical protein
LLIRQFEGDFSTVLRILNAFQSTDNKKYRGNLLVEGLNFMALLKVVIAEIINIACIAMQV